MFYQSINTFKIIQNIFSLPEDIVELSQHEICHPVTEPLFVQALPQLSLVVPRRLPVKVLNEISLTISFDQILQANCHLLVSILKQALRYNKTREIFKCTSSSSV